MEKTKPAPSDVVEETSFKVNRIAVHFQNLNANHFINIILKQGKKSKAETAVKKVIKQLTHTYFGGYSRVLSLVISRIRPIIEVKNIRRYGKSYSVPVPLRKHRSVTLATRWIFESSKANSQTAFIKNVLEVVDSILHNRGVLIKKKLELNKHAEKNRIFSHFRWY